MLRDVVAVSRQVVRVHENCAIKLAHEKTEPDSVADFSASKSDSVLIRIDQRTCPADDDILIYV